jgi:hypothetical protein
MILDPRASCDGSAVAEPGGQLQVVHLVADDSTTLLLQAASLMEAMT